MIRRPAFAYHGAMSAVTKGTSLSEGGSISRSYNLMMIHITFGKFRYSTKAKELLIFPEGDIEITIFKAPSATRGWAVRALNFAYTTELSEP